MKTNGIYILLFLLLANYTYQQNGFNQVHNLLKNFKQSNVNEQKEADKREKSEKIWCKKTIAAARKVKSQRIKDVNDLEGHKKYLKNEKKEHEKDKISREKRVVGNKALLEKFEKERCDSNLLFVKNLEEHVQALETLAKLKKDIIEYFAKKSSFIEKSTDTKSLNEETKLLEVQNTYINNFQEGSILIERIAKLSNSEHLFDLDHKILLAQLVKMSEELSNDTESNSDPTKTSEVNKILSTKLRTEKQIGHDHVDNKKGQLKVTKVDIVDYKTKERVLAMLDKLVEHLKASRKRLTEDEVKAAGDFASFKVNLAEEQSHLTKSIEALEKKIKNLTNQINVVNSQLIKRKSLKAQAILKLDSVISLCKEKNIYFIKETKRRNQENLLIDLAIKIFVKLMTRSKSYRATSRTNAEFSGKKLDNAIAQKVVKAKSGIEKSLQERIKSRKTVAF